MANQIVGYVMGPYGPQPVMRPVGGRRNWGRHSGRRVYGGMVPMMPGSHVHGYVMGQDGQPVPLLSPAGIPQALYAGGYPGGCAPACAPPPQFADQAQCPTPPGYTPGIAVPIPAWRGGMLAPGLPAPQEGQVVLPLRALTTDTFTFAGGLQTLTFQGRPQKPFKANRLIVVASHIPAAPGGPTTPAKVLGKVYVGTDPQQATLSNMQLEAIGAPTAFGTDLEFVQAEPGVDFNIDAILSIPLAIDGETVQVNIDAIGRWIS